MADFDETQISVGALSLAIWSSENMKWSELQALPTAKYGMVMKESDSERGKKICVTGNVVEISADSSGPQKVYLGGMADEQFHIYRFIAVGSTGEIVAGSNSRFCGVVTGKNDYSNSAGGVAHAIHLVGMFDLPENNPNKVGTSNTRHHKEHEIRLQDGTTGTVIDD